jgi:hypothetical protein
MAQSATEEDQNAILAPPPGLSRRPSMTVPWQVAESVLVTPQPPSTNRKQILANHNIAHHFDPKVGKKRKK